MQDRIKHQINDIERFKVKMTEFVKDESSKNLIFTEDLKNMLHIASSPEDIELLKSMMTKFCTQNREVRFGNFIFGPVVMRMFHNLGDADNALKFFKDETMSGFFDQLSTYQILLDLLFEQQRYQDVLDTYELISQRQVQGGRFPKHVIVLTFGAAYKLNTPESYKFASKLWAECNDVGHQPMRRAATFFAALCINQNEAGAALEVLSSIKNANYIHVRLLRALALAKVKRYDDVLHFFKGIIENPNPLVDKQTYPKEFVDILKADFAEIENKELLKDFTRICEFLEKHGHVQNITISDMLTAEIKITAQSAQNQQNYQQGGVRGPFNKRLVDQRLRRNELDAPSTGYIRRPGLHELN
jgi:pentatricopeptide repeat domain-containing protein 2